MRTLRLWVSKARDNSTIFSSSTFDHLETLTKLDPLSNLAFFCFLSLNVMPSTLPLPPCSGRWYPPAEDFKIWFRILKCGFKRKQLGFWNSLRPSPPPPAPLHHPLLTPMLFVLQRIFRLVEIFVFHNYLNIWQYTSEFSINWAPPAWFRLSWVPSCVLRVETFALQDVQLDSSSCHSFIEILDDFSPFSIIIIIIGVAVC